MTQILVCKDCGKRTPVFRGWAFCGAHCKGDATVKEVAYHAWELELKEVSLLNAEQRAGRLLAQVQAGECGELEAMLEFGQIMGQMLRGERCTE